MNFAAIYTIIGFTLFISIHSARSLSCYQCRSDKHADCEELVGKSYLQECVEEETLEESTTASVEADPVTKQSDSNTPDDTGSDDKDKEGEGEEDDKGKEKVEDETPPPLGPYITCRKIEQALYVKPPGDLVTIRECGRTYIGEKCVKTSNKLVYVRACDCKEDGCNHSNVFLVTVPLVVFSVVSNYLV